MGTRARRVVLALALPLLLASPARAGEDCFLATDLASGRMLAEDGDCAARHSPASTFKIALALMGFDGGILKSAGEPVFVTEPGLASGLPQWEGPQTPASWMRYSVVWYSQVLTLKLGAERFARYVRAFRYGNEDVAGNPGRNDGLTRAWLSSSLQISPREQVAFVSRLLKGELPVTPEAVALTTALMAQPEQPEGWALYGKTGSGTLPGPVGEAVPPRPFGWFVGFVRKGGQAVVFARFLAGTRKAEAPLSPRARAEALAALPALIAAESR